MNKQHYVLFMLEKTEPLVSPQKLITDVLFYLMCMLLSSALLYVNIKNLILSIVFAGISLVLLWPFLRQKNAVLRKIYVMAVSLVAFSAAIINVLAILIRQIGAFYAIPYGIIVLIIHVAISQAYIRHNIKKDYYHNKKAKHVTPKHAIAYTLAGALGIIISYIMGSLLSNDSIIVFYLIFGFWVIAWLLSISLIYFQVYSYCKKMNSEGVTR